MRCLSENAIRNHRGPVWRANTTLATMIKLTRFLSDMAKNNIQPMDISGSKSELSERWRFWLRGFTYFAEGKANLQIPQKEKRITLSGPFWSAGYFSESYYYSP